MERRSMHGSGKEVRPQYLQEHLLVLSTGSALDLMQQKQPEHRREREGLTITEGLAGRGKRGSSCYI